MKPSRRYKILIVTIGFCIAAMAISMIDSFRFQPDSSGDEDFMARAQQKSAPGMKVSASALGARESERSFGENLAKYDIQPVWLSIEDETDDQLIYLPIAMDPEYYSPYEVSYRFHGAFSFAANRARDTFFLQRQISGLLPPHSRTTGFVYGVLDAGVKYAHILITGNGRLETFDFALPVPGPAFVGTGVRADGVYPGQKIEDLGLEALRTTLAKYPCCTSNSSATRDGDPLNLVLVESKSDPIVPFIAREWHLTRKLDVASMIETARAFIFRDEFLTSPVSPLYVFGRREDLALQKARSTINERVHARLWLTPYTFEARRVWIGQVSRDIGVRLTDQTWNLTTHKISPDVDFDRGYLLQDLLMSGSVERYGFVDGVGAAPASAPRVNLTGDPYYTDGLRVVVFLSDQTNPLSQSERLRWELPPPISQEAR
jgi:LssY-like putative type I secretion system component LssY